ncbi:hypothetical protein D3OALGA1CA_4400 [Olavius algarvensis associated proteobacterium Delta 3]|nr:hypothetical protein D3OALGA1CA_4400 [Olavius algarvensis associated proteobacterium Delta 3]CAB5162409.1 hypothetical protein D3OALGB2SA_5511 [Olavius algarvensis associated proteobacterium Delta 3]
MTEDGFDPKGQDLYKELFGAERKFNKDKDTDLDRMTVNHVFRNVWSRRTHLSIQERSMITVALLAALGWDHELERHVQGAMNQKITVETIDEIMIHVAHYAGWPAGHNGRRISRKVFSEFKLCAEQTQSEKRIVFCDFDGTITTEETFEGLLRKFVPHLADQKIGEMACGTLSLQEGVKGLLGEIESDQYERVKTYYRNSSILRTGFMDLMDLLCLKNVDFIILSGGLEEMVKFVWEEKIHTLSQDNDGLKTWLDKIKILGGKVDRSHSKFKAYSNYEDSQSTIDREFVSKKKIMKEYLNEGNFYSYDLIYIGDGMTDKKAAKWLIHEIEDEESLNNISISTIVFARDKLKDSLEPGTFVPWKNFNDIRNCLSVRWKGLSEINSDGRCD